jgi:4-alpha-glucanotransferase
MKEFRKKFSYELEIQCALQYFFHRQWQSVHRRANELNIKIIGDVPIFVSHDSADVWANDELFDLDSSGKPQFVAGVPPDYFSKTGQRWGNPLYCWDMHKKTNYSWWAGRLRRALKHYDALRIDHFRAFADYWEIPAEESTAMHGRWQNGPGKGFFLSIAKQLGQLPLIAEDLGMLSDAATTLRDELDIPGLRVLLFAFDEYNQSSPFLPENFVENCVAYTGTHDNDTICGTFFCDDSSSKTTQRRHISRRFILTKLLPRHLHKMPFHHALMKWMADSVAKWVIFPMQDVLCLGSYARTNTPGTVAGNWKWKLTNSDLEKVDKDFIAKLRPLRNNDNKNN